MPPKRASTSNANYTAAGALSDDSDLDDLFDELSDDDEVDKKPKKKGPPNSAEIIKGQMNKPHNIMLATRSLHDMIHTGSVKLDPDYQRDVVWSEQKMMLLIQSIFMNYYVPPIIFAVSKDEAGNHTRICIDGKQRCTSILWFMDGKIPFESPNTRQKYWYTKFAGHRGQQLPKDLKTQFDLFQLTAVEYYDMTDIQQRDVFQRVQLGVQLSSAEKLQAHGGPWPEWITELEKRYVTAEATLGKKLNWVTNRGRIFQNLLGLVATARESSPNKIWSPAISGLKRFVERGDPPDQDFKNRINLTLSVFINIAYNHWDEAFETTTTNRIAPVEFWFGGYLIYSRMGFLSVRALAQEIGKMRAMIRHHVPGNVSANTTVFALLSDFILAIPKKRKLEEVPAAEQYEADDDVDEREARALKRSRRAEELDPTYNDEWTERAIISPTKVATRAKAAAPIINNAGSSSASPVVQAQPRPAPVDVSVASSGRPIASLPTPQTSTQPAQPVYNQQPPAPNGLGNTSQQWRDYTEARIKQQYPQSFQQQ
ncbi:hypothetical protein I302_103662 [Kwoniella bestiolae CBS 10118]|uniref:GmrSD restriction endonucleases N-terminal domain-containing protein n=1 Tax=Kwoniella bestiolae CBS 10118 TaxID=1296100 RepID=A0A1B9G903_9TREE|nr:hypothetical protein I302_02367 [Kwoniella bestiolae CBS 10118]OCF27525.1 hypothetical protein I302_02367 [Kwoniella bestiolae CBS 10118]